MLLTWYIAVFLGRSRQTAQHKTEPKRDSNFSSFLGLHLTDVSNFCFFASGSSKLCFETVGMLLLSGSGPLSVVGMTEIVAVVDGPDESTDIEEDARFSTRISAVIRFDENELVEGSVATESAIFIVFLFAHSFFFRCNFSLAKKYRKCTWLLSQICQHKGKLMGDW